MTPRYQPLADYLADYLAAQGSLAVMLTLAEIEALLGAPLPPAAQEASWWTPAPARRRARAWHGAGWRVRMMTQSRRTWAIIFERGPSR